MNRKKSLQLTLLVALTVVCLQATALGQTVNDGKLANMTGGGSSIRLDVIVQNSGFTLTIASPDGRTFRRDYKAGAAPEFTIVDKSGERLPDGTYTYELRLSPVLAPGSFEKLKAARGRDDDSEADRASRKLLLPPPLVQSGSFAILNGSVIVAGAVEDSARTAKITERLREVTTARTLARLRNHPMSPGAMPDFVIADDLIVQGSACVGLDCVNGEVFGFDTIRMKENNTRLQYDDTSTTAGFPTNNWQIRANSSASGGASFLAFVDQGATGNSETGTIVFEVDAGAPANSLRVSSTGRIGLRTATPVLALHINESDTPDMRLEQNNSGGFSAQTWDIAGNEANFFVRDVTSGSRLPFRIRPGAPTSSLDISADGDTGIGIASPALRLHAHGAVAGLPATSGTTQNGITRFSQGVGNGVVDFGFGGAAGLGWIQATDSTNLATNFGLLLNPNGGNVGIGTTAPTQTLSVNGTAGKPAGGSWDVFSDERLKNVKGRFNLGLKAVMQLQPLRYEYKPDNALGIKLPGEHLGFGAQQLQKIIPEAVSTNSAGFLMVNNDPILWTMLNAIKEQQEQIAKLEAQVRKLQTVGRRRR